MLFYLTFGADDYQDGNCEMLEKIVYIVAFGRSGTLFHIFAAFSSVFSMRHHYAFAIENIIFLIILNNR